MNPGYRRGMSIVAGTVLWAFVLHLGYSLLPSGDTARTAKVDLTPTDPAIGPFTFQDQSNQPFGADQLQDKVWVAAFIFTRCPASCPRITATMRGLQDRLKDTKIQFVSISVDPKYDTPEVLDRYAKANGAQPGRWHFLTGPRDYTYALINDRFHLPVSEATKEAMDRGDEMVLHSDRLVLVDRGNRVVNYYSSEDADKVKDLIERARRLDAAAWVRRLPAVNAALNGTCVVFLLMGWGFIRNFKPVPHIACMIAALTVSAAFLTCYLIYHFQVGSMPFRGVGWTRHVYYTVLLSHTVLAAAVVPMLAITITRAVRKRYPEHARFSRTTFPVWLYVSITGVLIYMMLYQLPAPG